MLRARFASSLTPPSCCEQSQRAQAGIALGFAFFLAMQVAAALVHLPEHWRPEARDPEYGQKLHALRRRLAAEPGRPLILVIGSSRTEVGLRPGAISGLAAPNGLEPLVFNYGLPGAEALTELLCLHRLLKAGIRPDWVLVEILPPALHEERGAEESIHPERLAWGDLELLRRYSTRPWELYRDYGLTHLVTSRCAAAWMPWLDGRGVRPKNMDEAGWVDCLRGAGDPAAYRRRVEHIRQEYVGYFNHFRVSPRADRSLHELLDRCRTEGIRVALFIMPEASDFRAWYSPAMEEELARYCARLSRDYQVPFCDARTWVADKGFYDGHHLLADGACTFSERFGREVIRPLLENRTSSFRR
jgi:hypothetical protein